MPESARSPLMRLHRQSVDLESIRQLTGHKSLESLTLYIDIGREEANQKIASAISDPNFGVFLIMQSVNGRFISDSERNSPSAKIYLVNLETGAFTLLQEFDDTKDAELFVREGMPYPYPYTLLNYNDTLVPISNRVASLCSWIKTGSF